MPSQKNTFVLAALLFATRLPLLGAAPQTVATPSIAQVWADYDPNKGDFKEEIVKEEIKDENYYRESDITAYLLGEEVRIYCQYKVRAGALKAPALLNVHGWMGSPSIDKEYVRDGWAVMTYDYCGKTGERPQ